MGNQLQEVVKSSFHKKPETYTTLSSRKGVKPTKEYDIKLTPSLQSSTILGDIDIDVDLRKSAIKIKENQIDNLREQGPLLVENKKAYPYSAVGVVHGLKMLPKGTLPTFGTGCIIGPNLILTCAHNCFSPQSQQLLLNLEFIPSISESQFKKNELYEKGFKVKQVYIPKQYKEHCQSKKEDERYLYDYAFLRVQDINLEEYFGSFGYDFQWHQKSFKEVNSSLEEMKVVCYRQGHQKLQMNQLKGSAFSQNEFLVYKMKTQPGNSGSPIFTQTPEDCVIRGIHQRTFIDEIAMKKDIRLKSGLKLSKRIFQDVKDNFSTGRQYHVYDLKLKQLEVDHSDDIIEAITTIQDNYEGERSMMVLDLTLNQIGEKGCQLLSSAPWINLHTLDLTQNCIGQNGCKFLAQSKNWPNLEKLLLPFNNIKDKGCEYISKGEWPKLKLLDLTTNQIHHQGCFLLAQGNWKSLESLILLQNQVGKQSMNFFAQLKWTVKIDQKYQ